MGEERKPGLFCWLGKNDIAAGVARGMMMTFSVLGPLVGAAIFWWVHDLGTKLDKIDDRFTMLFERLNTIDKFDAAEIETMKDRDAKIDDLRVVERNHENRISCLEFSRPCRGGP